MIKHLLEMYDQTEAGDGTWVQCLSYTDFKLEVRIKVLAIAGRKVRFQIVSD